MHSKINEKKYIDFSFSYGTEEYIIKDKNTYTRDHGSNPNS